MQTAPQKSAPNNVMAVTGRRQPDAYGFIRCSYCGYPAAYSVNWSEQKPCPSCGYKFPDFLQPPISAPVPARPKPIKPRNTTPVTAPAPITTAATVVARSTKPPAAYRKTRGPILNGQCPICHQAAANNIICNDCWTLIASQSPTVTRALTRKSMASALLWGGTAFGVAPFILESSYASPADCAIFQWACALAVAALVFRYLRYAA